jgi:hypothetical protein
VCRNAGADQGWSRDEEDECDEVNTPARSEMLLCRHQVSYNLCWRRICLMPAEPGVLLYVRLQNIGLSVAADTSIPLRSYPQWSVSGVLLTLNSAYDLLHRDRVESVAMVLTVLRLCRARVPVR